MALTILSMALTMSIYGTYDVYLWHLRCLTMALVILTDYFVTDDTCDTYFYIIYIVIIIYINKYNAFLPARVGII